ncbi:alcohol oxidase [Pseudovirgaria hyperparasitica]|uniref:Alcohol oxidase n=1 Tax=Pseudovirgaria hyperparasitica TaxID=470096 RepID=A0A6A6W076_9PEZI|nr:alcohol oxidase [Pseudovirgaria hyperparasitica]KAF2754977.1 alcohol oxidase [Pseudovirgaria hyperparasitica]
MAPARIIDTPVVTNTYDYIVCGGGTAGCVIAGRLAETTTTRILLIEAGPDSKDLATMHMPGDWMGNFDNNKTDWNIVTEPMAGANGRRVKCSRGRFLGGSSGVNGTLCIRGTRQDYDDWGLEGWGGEDVFGYMKKAETFHPSARLKGAAGVHGTEGPLHVASHELAPISERVMESMVEKGLPLCEDMFSTGETAHGCGHVPRTIHRGVRTTAADFVTKGFKRENITIMTDVTVDKIVVESQGDGLRATAVDLVAENGTRSRVGASKEVIVSAGAYCSPAILLRSGIGAKDELEKLGIECVADLPGVGRNLMDHILTFQFYQVTEPGLTYDSQVFHDPQGLAKLRKQYGDTKSGFLSVFPFGAFCFARLDDRLEDCEAWKNAPRKPGRDPMGLAPNQPNIEMWNTELYGGPKQFDSYPIDGSHTFAMCTLLFNSNSRGSVRLASSDPLKNPLVDHNYLDHELDLQVLAEACRYSNEIVMEGVGTKNIVKGSWPPGLKHHTHKTREDWIPHVKNSATTCYHASGTCKMGKSDDPMAVLDEKLRVRGIDGLRVADASVMPIVNNGHTQMATYAIAEKAADLIKADAR